MDRLREIDKENREVIERCRRNNVRDVDASLSTIPQGKSSCQLAEEVTKGKERGTWSNQLEFILSCLSFAVGLGNIWRFPYLCYRNGGGAFLIPYALSLLFMGLPVFLYELSLGQFSGKGPVSVWKICPLFQGVGYGMFTISLLIGIYYNIILAWAIFYIVSSFAAELPWSTCGNWWNTEACHIHNVSAKATEHQRMPSDEFFHNRVLNMTEGIHHVGELRLELAGCLFLAWFIVFCGLWDGVKSFGKLVYFTALFPYVILTILLVRAATLDGFTDGILFYITPRWEKLMHITVWADACVQIFFSLGVTWGGMITLASYNKFTNNCYRDALCVGIGNCLTSFFAGFVLFGIIGFMAHELQVPVEEVVAQGAGLAFIAYPEAVTKLPISPLWSILFFLMLLTLGLGTQLSTVETVVTIISDEFRIRGNNRKYLLLVVCLSMYLTGLSICTEGGMYILQLLDNHAATFSALILGCIEISVMAWVYGADRFLEDVNYMLGFYPYPRLFWKYSWKCVSPLIIIAILIFTWLDYEGNSYGDYHYPTWANAVGWCITFTSVAMVPAVAIYKIAKTPGSIKERLRTLLSPTYDWAPSTVGNILNHDEE